MNAATALAALQNWSEWTGAAWAALAIGLVVGLGVGVSCARWLPHRPKSGFSHDLLALTPAIVACLLWGCWLGIMAAKFAP